MYAEAISKANDCRDQGGAQLCSPGEEQPDQGPESHCYKGAHGQISDSRFQRQAPRYERQDSGNGNEEGASQNECGVHKAFLEDEHSHKNYLESGGDTGSSHESYEPEFFRQDDRQTYFHDGLGPV